MSYYTQVRNLADRVITHHRDDLLVHDRESLKEYTGEFIHMTRDTGTYLVKLIPFTEYPEAGVKVPYLFGTADRERIIRSMNHFVQDDVLSRHSLILHGKNGKVSKIGAENARKAVQDYIRQGFRFWYATKMAA